MKYLSQYVTGGVIMVFLLAGLVIPKGFSNGYADSAMLNGAWHNTNGSIEQSFIIADGYCMLTKYDKVNKKFIHSFGGPLTPAGDKISLKVELNKKQAYPTGGCKIRRRKFEIRREYKNQIAKNKQNSNIKFEIRSGCNHKP